MESHFESLSISERKIIVAIDFGTTYSGIAWAETQRHDRRTAITTWPISQTVRDGKTSEKVPTKLRHVGKNVQWGFQVPLQAPPAEVSEWFKLYALSNIQNSLLCTDRHFKETWTLRFVLQLSSRETGVMHRNWSQTTYRSWGSTCCIPYAKN